MACHRALYRTGFISEILEYDLQQWLLHDHRRVDTRYADEGRRVYWRFGESLRHVHCECLHEIHIPPGL